KRLPQIPSSLRIATPIPHLKGSQCAKSATLFQQPARSRRHQGSRSLVHRQCAGGLAATGGSPTGSSARSRTPFSELPTIQPGLTTMTCGEARPQPASRAAGCSEVTRRRRLEHLGYSAGKTKVDALANLRTEIPT